MVITDAQKTKRGRISVYIDGDFLFAVEADAWYGSGLSTGCETDEEQLNALLSQSNLIKAKRRALNMLSARDYSSGALVSRLSQKTDAASAKAAAERMEELGLIDDERYAMRLAEELYGKGFGRRRIEYELQKRRLSPELVSQAVESLDLSGSEERAAGLLSRRFGQLVSDADVRRAAAFLERQGYTYSDIGYAVRQCRANNDD